MRYSRLSAVAACVAVSSAFLLPTEISNADIDIIKTLPFEDAVSIDNRVVEINCPGCPVVSDIEGKMHSAQVQSILQLNFSLAHEDGLDKLMLNGMQIYPLDPRSSTFMEPLTASQMVKTSDDTWAYSSTPKLGYSLSIRHPALDKNEQIDVISIHMEIVEVADQFLSGLPTVDIELLETPSHQLMIGNAEIHPPKSQVSKPTDDGQECTNMLCKWAAIFTDRLSKLKGACNKGKPIPVEAHPKHHGHHGQADSEPMEFHGHPGEAEGRPKHHGHHGEHDRPHGHGPDGPHRPYRHHHRHGGFSRFLRGIVMHIFIPVLIGIMVGVTVSLIGMVVGHILIFLWRITFRRGQSSQCRKYTRLAEVEATTDDEAKSFLQHQGPPPEYEVVVQEEKPEDV
jgi:hypothetical protein